jgi:hypothetical protein
MLFNPTHP